MFHEAVELLPELGIDGLEIAPSAIWEASPDIDEEKARRFRDELRAKELEVSGLQSLLYGKPDLQILDRECWSALLKHLSQTTDLAAELGAEVMVLGSPRNRIRGRLSDGSADRTMVDFLSDLLPTLQAHELVLTIEPNAPAYGADYLTTYTSVLALVEAVDSRWIQPQVDTGCLLMVGEDPASAIRNSIPAHIHISAPSLGPPSASLDTPELISAIEHSGYSGWLVLEMLPSATDELETVVQEASWLVDTFGPLRESVHGSR